MSAQFLCYVHKQKRYARYLMLSDPEVPNRFECRPGQACKVPGTWKCPECGVLNEASTDPMPTCKACGHKLRDTSLETNTIIVSSVPTTHIRLDCAKLKEHLSQWGQVEMIKAMRGYRVIVRFATVQAAKRAVAATHKIGDEQMYCKLIESTEDKKRKAEEAPADEEEKPKKSQKVAHGVHAGIRGRRSGTKKKTMVKKKSEKKSTKRREKYREEKKKEKEAGVEDKSGPKGAARREAKEKLKQAVRAERAAKKAAKAAAKAGATEPAGKKGSADKKKDKKDSEKKKEKKAKK